MRLRAALIAVALALASTASAQNLRSLPLATSTTGGNDALLTLISDSAYRTRAMTLVQFRKALSVTAFDSLITTKLNLTGATVTGAPTWSATQSLNTSGSAGSAPASALTGTTLAAGVTGSSLTSLGTQAADLLFTDALYDIGKTAATRPRDGFFSRNLTIGGTTSLQGVTATTATLNGALSGVTTLNTSGAAVFGTTGTSGAGRVTINGSAVAEVTFSTPANSFALGFTTTGTQRVYIKDGGLVERLGVTGTGVDITGPTTFTSTLAGATTQTNGNGSATTPSYSYTNSTGLGVYRFGADTLGIAAAGGNVANWASNGLTFAASKRLGFVSTDTVIGTPVWASTQAFATAQRVDSATGSARAQTLTTTRALWGQNFNGSAALTAALTGDNGSAATPQYSFTNSTGSGFYRFGADTIGVATGGVNTLQVSGGTTAKIAGGAGNMTLTAGTGNSRTMTLQTTTNAGTAKNTVVLGADTSATFLGAAIAPKFVTASGTQSVANSSATTIFTVPQDGIYLCQAYNDGNNAQISFIIGTGAAGSASIGTISTSTPTVGTHSVSLQGGANAQIFQNSGGALTYTWMYVRIR